MRVTSQQRTPKRVTESNGNSSTVPWRGIADAIAQKRGAVAPDRAMLVGVSGIDASGKGFITTRLAKRLRDSGWNTAAISADDWLNLPDACIDRDNPAEHFYENAIRFDEMFGRLILPLTQRRTIEVTINCADAKATTYRKHRYDFRDIDIVLLEGILLFKPIHRDHFDLKIWIECSFETALQRAIARGQEGLSPAETIKAFETIYFPAQRIHLARDNPRGTAGIILANDEL